MSWKCVGLIALFTIFSNCNTKRLKDDMRMSEKIISVTPTINSHLAEEEGSSALFGPFRNSENGSDNIIPDLNFPSTHILFSSAHPGLSSKKTKVWGGNCTAVHWERCSSIKQWGGNYSILDKNDPAKKRMLQKQHIIDCKDEEEVNRIVCLRNGWTVSRCNLLCMAECNRNLLRYWNRYVSHYGECRLKQKNDEFMDLECRVKKLTLFKKLGCPSTKAECHEKKLAFILKQLGCDSTNVS